MYFYFLKLNLKRILQSGLKNFSRLGFSTAWLRVCLAEKLLKIAENCRQIAENYRQISPIYTLLRVGSPRAPCCCMLQLCGCAEWGKRNGQAASQPPARVFSMKKFWSAALAPHGAGGHCQKLVLININNYIIDCY